MVAGFVATAAALGVMLLFGHAVGSGGRHVTQLHRVSLRPVAGAPKMPPGTYAVDLSPDQRKLVAASPRRLTFYDRGSGRRLGSIALPHRNARPMWLTPDRLVATVTPNRFPEDRAGRVMVIDSGTFKVRKSIRIKGIADSARSGDKVIVYLRRSAGSAESALEARVLDEADRFRSPIALPFVGNSGNFTLGAELEIAGDRVYANDGSDFCSGDPQHRGVLTVDPVGNAAALTPLSFEKGCPTQFAPGSGGGQVPVLLDGEGDNTSSGRATVLSGSTFEKVEELPVRPRDPQVPDVPVCAARDGFVVFGRQVTFREPDGAIRWKADDSADNLYTPCAVTDGHVYFPHRRGRGWEMRVRRTSDGQLVRRVRGRYTLFEPLAGRSSQQVPQLSPPIIADEE